MKKKLIKEHITTQPAHKKHPMTITHTVNRDSQDPEAKNLQVPPLKPSQPDPKAIVIIMPDPPICSLNQSSREVSFSDRMLEVRQPRPREGRLLNQVCQQKTGTSTSTELWQSLAQGPGQAAGESGAPDSRILVPTGWEVKIGERSQKRGTLNLAPSQNELRTWRKPTITKRGPAPGTPRWLLPTACGRDVMIGMLQTRSPKQRSQWLVRGHTVRKVAVLGGRVPPQPSHLQPQTSPAAPLSWGNLEAPKLPPHF